MKHAPLIVAALVILCRTHVSPAGLVVTAEAPGIQSSQVAGVTTENFDGFSSSAAYLTGTSLTTAVGALTAPSPGFGIVGATIFGGAGGTGNYFAVGNLLSLQATLALNGPQAYFGFWWSAADQFNQVEFLSGGQVVATFNPATALGDLADPGYFGNPNNGADGGERFAYLNFFGTGGTTFDEIRFLNPSNASDFEADNFSVFAGPLTPSGSVLEGAATVSSPEPNSLTILATASIGLGFLRWRRRKRL